MLTPFPEGSMVTLPKIEKQIGAEALGLPSVTYGRLAIKIVAFLQEQGSGPGERLPAEHVLAAVFGVGRGTVRRALMALEIKGYIETVTGVGSFLVDRSAGLCPGPGVESSPLLALRACLTIEPMIAGQAAALCAASSLSEMRKHIAHMGFLAGDAADAAAFRKSDIALHEMLSAAAGRQLGLISGQLWRNFYELQGPSALHCLSLLEWQLATLESYECLLHAIAQHDVALATRTMRRYLMGLQEFLRYGTAGADPLAA